MYVLRPPPAGGEPLRLRAVPRGTLRTRPPALCRAARRRPLRTLQPAHGRGSVALRPLPCAGEGARLSRAGKHRRKKNATQDDARGARVWIVESPPGARPAVRAAHIVPTPARQSDTWRCSGRRRLPWSNWRRATSWGSSRPNPRPPPASPSPACAMTRWSSAPTYRSWRCHRHERGPAEGVPKVNSHPTFAILNRHRSRHRPCGPRGPRESGGFVSSVPGRTTW